MRVLKVGLVMLIVLVLGVLLLQTNVLAQATPRPLDPVCSGAGADSSTCSAAGTVNNPVVAVLVNVIRIILLAVGVAAVIVIIVSGFRYITSSGDPASVNGAKNGILFAVIGLIIALVGQFIVTFVVNRL